MGNAQTLPLQVGQEQALIMNDLISLSKLLAPGLMHQGQLAAGTTVDHGCSPDQPEGHEGTRV